jgi:hypothetical protein
LRRLTSDHQKTWFQIEKRQRRNWHRKSFIDERHPEAMPPEPHRFVAYPDTAPVQQIFDIPERDREPDIQHHCQADDLGAGLEVLEG